MQEETKIVMSKREERESGAAMTPNGFSVVTVIHSISSHPGFEAISGLNLSCTLFGIVIMRSYYSLWMYSSVTRNGLLHLHAGKSRRAKNTKAKNNNGQKPDPSSWSPRRLVSSLLLLGNAKKSHNTNRQRSLFSSSSCRLLSCVSALLFNLTLLFLTTTTITNNTPWVPPNPTR